MNLKLAFDKKWLIGIGLALAVFLLIWYIVIRALPGAQVFNPPAQPSVRSDKLRIQKTEVPVEKLPSRFPANIPLEAGAKVLQNYNATVPDGRYQATRVFETTQSLDKNFTLYKNFFSQNGWTILTTLNEDKLKLVSASKDRLRAQVSIGENSLTKRVSVNISVLELPK